MADKRNDGREDRDKQEIAGQGKVKETPENDLIDERYEIIEGVRYDFLSSPAYAHQQVLRDLILGFHQNCAKDGEVLFAPLDVHFDEDNIFQPDLIYIANANRGIMRDGYIYGAPDLVVEILSASTGCRDKTIKKNGYEKFGVREYWLVDPVHRFVEQFVLMDGKYAAVATLTEEQTLTSPTVPCLHLNLGDILREDEGNDESEAKDKQGKVKETPENYLIDERYEIIEGVRYDFLSSPIYAHQRVLAKLYLAFHNGCAADGEVLFAPLDVHFDENNIFQPDLIYIANTNRGIIRDGYIYGAPDLVVEILSASTGRRDKTIKKNGYEKFGVREYWLVDPVHRFIEQFVLLEGKYAAVATLTEEQTLTSPTVPCLNLNLGDILREDEGNDESEAKDKQGKVKETPENYLIDERYEIIGGVRYDFLSSPVYAHQRVLGELHFAFRNDCAADGEVLLAPLDVHFDEDNIFQPDLIYITNANRGIIRDGYIYGAPDLVVEILSASTGRRDKTIKKNGYEKFGVREYWLVDPVHRFLEQFVLMDGKYAAVATLTEEQTLTSPTVPCLSLKLEGIFPPEDQPI
mgnify:CR=1 FL=1|jgi:Uncharacterized protein conserved in cyanobacteria